MKLFVLKVKTRRLINKGHELVAVSDNRVTAIKLNRKRRKYVGKMAALYDTYQVMDRNLNGKTTTSMNGHYKHVRHFRNKTVVKLRLKKKQLVEPRGKDAALSSSAFLNAP